MRNNGRAVRARGRAGALFARDPLDHRPPRVPVSRARTSRYLRRFSSTFSTPIGAKRLPIVPVDSSAARMPLPGDAMYRAVAISSAAYSDMFADELAASSAKTTRRASGTIESASPCRASRGGSRARAAPNDWIRGFQNPFYVSSPPPSGAFGSAAAR